MKTGSGSSLPRLSRATQMVQEIYAESASFNGIPGGQETELDFYTVRFLSTGYRQGRRQGGAHAPPFWPKM